MGNRAGLTGGSATAHIGNDVDLVFHLNREERSKGRLAEVFVSEVIFELTLVGGEFAGAGSDAHASSSGLATASGGENGSGFSSHR